MNILRLWRGDVNRWHSHPSRLLRQSGDTIHAHSARCAMLLLHLKPNASADELEACILHDAAETITGDIPYAAKRRWTMPDMSDADEELGVNVSCSPWVKLADNLDAYLWMLSVDGDLRFAHEWRKMRTEILRLADDMEVGQSVVDILIEAEDDTP